MNTKIAITIAITAWKIVAFGIWAACMSGCDAEIPASSRAIASDPAPRIIPAAMVPAFPTKEQIADAVVEGLSKPVEQVEKVIDRNTEAMDRIERRLAMMDSQTKSVAPPAPDYVPPPNDPPAAGPVSQTTQSGDAAAAGPIFSVYMSSGYCPQCDDCKRDIEGDPQFQIVASLDPQVTAIANGSTYPVITFNVNGQRRFVTGWHGKAWLKRRYAANFSQRTMGGVQAPVYGSPIYYRSNRSSWTWPGNLRYHLTQPPHSYSPSVIQTWSDDQCIRVHDSYHNLHGANKSLRADYVAARHKLKADYHAAKHANKAVAASQPNVLVRMYRAVFYPTTTTYRTYYTQPTYRTYRTRTYSTYGICPNC